MPLYVGVDGGSTKTIAVVINEDKKELGSFSTGSSNKNSVGAETAKTNIHKAILGALDQAKLSIDDIEGICLGLSGADRPEDKIMVASWMEGFSKARLRIESDPMTNLSSGTLGVLHGMIVIGGTGSICVGTDGTHSFRAGGWGPMLGDNGNGWGIGHDVLVSVCRAHDGLGDETTLFEALKEEIKIGKAEDIIAWTYSDLSWARIASLAPLALKCAEKGDKVSLEILDRHSNSVIENAHVIAKKLHWDNIDFTLVLCGSLLTSEGIFQNMLTKKLAIAFPKAKITLPIVSPSIGAALLCLQK
jgi:N-acetylglucosamine kinase-like BadF-type ATPase